MNHPPVEQAAHCPPHRHPCGLIRIPASLDFRFTQTEKTLSTFVFPVSTLEIRSLLLRLSGSKDRLFSVAVRCGKGIGRPSGKRRFPICPAEIKVSATTFIFSFFSRKTIIIYFLTKKRKRKHNHIKKKTYICKQAAQGQRQSTQTVKWVDGTGCLTCNLLEKTPACISLPGCLKSSYQSGACPLSTPLIPPFSTDGIHP